MRRFGRLKALVLSCYSRDLYKDVAANWKGIGALYVLLLLSLTWIPSAVRWHRALGDYVGTSGRELARQLPIVTVRNGEMRATPGGRHEIKDPNTAEMFLIVDDTIDRVPENITQQTMVLTRREFGIINPQRNERRIHQLGPGVAFELTPAKAERFLGGLPVLVAPLMYVACVAGSFVFRLLQVLLYGQIGLFFARRLKAALDDKAAMRIAAVAITPVILIRTAVWFLPAEPAWYVRWPIGLAISMAFLWFGVKAAAESTAPAAPVTPASA